MRTFSCDVYVKFLASSIAPKLLENPSCRFLLPFCIDVVGVDQDIGIDKSPIAHATRFCPLELLHPNGSHRPEEPSPAARRVHTPLQFPPGIRSGERGGR